MLSFCVILVGTSVMDDWVSMALMGLVLVFSVWVLLRPPQPPIAQVPGGQVVFERQNSLPQSATARAGHCKTVRVDSLSPNQKSLHARLPVKLGVRPISLSGNSLFEDRRAHTISQATVQLLVDLIAVSDLFLLFKVDGEAEMKAIQLAIRNVPELTWNPKIQSGIQTHKLLFCSSVAGKIALVRQIEPVVTIEDNKDVVLGLRPFLPSIVYINATGEILPPAQSTQRDNVDTHPSLEAYYKLLTV
ncbi:hypothetical protein AeMF1_009353 [Aphanomyces euteiches]|nr:hypothetical protein AeMF1_009353 [Aphanomyces euteiches]KAH9197829.1 hypothetical protein AeNC1_000196 [Aphanomyces euteiches]